MGDFGSFLPKKLGDTEINKWEDGFQKFCVKFGGEAGRGQNVYYSLQVGGLEKAKNILT